MSTETENRTPSFALQADRRLHGRAALGPLQSLPRALWHSIHRSTDLRRLEEAAVRLQAPVGTGRRIAVTSSRGGAGRTTLTAVLAQTFGRFRLEPIGAVDLDPGHGSLRLRLGPLTVHDDGDPSSTADRVARHIRDHGTGGADDFLAPLELSPHRVHHTAARSATAFLGSPEVRDLLAGFSRFFPVTLTDCAAGYLPMETRAAVESSHCLLHVLPADALAVDETLGLLAADQPQRGNPEPPAVIAVVETRRNGNASVKEAVTALRRRGFPAHHVPFDRHLAGGVSITPRLMLPRTRRVAAEIAADLLEHATGKERTA